MLRWTSPPRLSEPVVVAAFSGWNDAGDAATDALRFILRSVGSEPAGFVEPDGHVDYQATRPHTEIVAGTVRSISWPTTDLHVSEAAQVVAVIGPEPSFGWKSYCESLVSGLAALRPRLVVTLGALLGDTPHTRAITITGTATDRALMDRLRLEPSRYEGPTGIVGVFHASCQTAGLGSASLWAPVPHYASSAPSPKASAALVERFGELTGIEIDTGRLRIAAAAWEEQVGALIARDDEVARYVADLEAEYERRAAEPTEDEFADTEPHESTTSIDPAQADQLAADIEAFLAERDDDD